MMKSSAREGQTEWVTHSWVSVALLRTLSPCILAECRWGLWPGREEPSEERVMVDPGWQRQSREGSLLILFDLLSEPENKTEPPSERSGLLAEASGWSHRAQVRGITLTDSFNQTCRTTQAGVSSGTEGITEEISCWGCAAPARNEHPDDIWCSFGSEVHLTVYTNLPFVLFLFWSDRWSVLVLVISSTLDAAYTWKRRRHISYGPFALASLPHCLGPMNRKSTHQFFYLVCRKVLKW